MPGQHHRAFDGLGGEELQQARSRALLRVRGWSTVSTTPSSMVMMGLTERTPPMAAWAALIRPPRLRYSSVSSTT